MKNRFTKVLFVFAALLFTTVTVNAQEQKFNVGEQDLNIGFGFGTPWSSSGVNTTFPAISATYDMGLRDDWGPGVFGVGGYFGAAAYSTKDVLAGVNLDYGYRYTIITLAGRATYHYTFVDDLDTYGGAILGFSSLWAKPYGDWGAANPESTSDLEMVFDIFVGAKYYFSDSFAAYAELATGSNIPVLTIGAAFKF